jgi:hypothetical protein
MVSETMTWIAAVGEYSCQRIIDLVGHSCCQSAEGGELIRLEQLQSCLCQLVGHTIKGLGQHPQLILSLHLDPVAEISTGHFPRGREEVLDWPVDPPPDQEADDHAQDNDDTDSENDNCNLATAYVFVNLGQRHGDIQYPEHGLRFRMLVTGCRPA